MGRELRKGTQNLLLLVYGVYRSRERGWGNIRKFRKLAHASGAKVLGFQMQKKAEIVEA